MSTPRAPRSSRPHQADALRAAVSQERSKAQKLELALEEALVQNADLRNKLRAAQKKLGESSDERDTERGFSRTAPPTSA